MYSMVSRFTTNNSSRALNPMEKLEESVDLLLQNRISATEYEQVLGQIFECVESAYTLLSKVEFPANYDAGPVLLEYAHVGLESFAEAVGALNELGLAPDASAAAEHLQQAREAYQALSDVLKEVQNERYNY